MRPRIHDKYLLKQFIRVLLFSVLAFTIIYVVIDVFEEIDNFIDHNAKLRHIALYYLYSIPFILTYIIPVSLLLGTVFSMGIMARRNELTALISSGISLVRIAAPVLLASIFVSLGSAYFNDDIVAKANRRKDNVMFTIEGREEQNPDIKQNFHYLGEGGFLYLADSYRHSSQALYDVVVQQFDENTLIRRIDARKATWQDSVWVFHNGYVRTFESNTEFLEAFDTLSVEEIVESPEDFAKEEVNWENMNFIQLRDYVDKVRRSGGRVEKYLVDMYFKLSFPFSGSIFVLIGIAFASGKRKQSIATGFGVTLVVAFMYYGVLRVGQTLGHNGVMPPFLAAQMGNIIFLVIGLFLLARANR